MILKFNKDIYDYTPEPCSAGSTKGYNFSLALNENGEQYLEYEEFDQQKVIDSYADQCSIERVIVSHGLGDELLMNQKPGVYLDEEQLNVIKNAGSNNLELNAQLFSLYQNYKDCMSFDEFSNFVAHGDYQALDKAKKSKEEAVE